VHRSRRAQHGGAIKWQEVAAMSSIRMSVIAILLGLGVSALAAAQVVPLTQSAPHHASMSASPANAQAREVIKPGDRNCIRDTGSLIPARKGQCLQGAFGRSYSAKELRSTGQSNTADALRMLDPAIH